MDLLEERVEAMERALGLDEHPNARPKDVDVAALRKSMVDGGFQRIFNIPQEKLKKLQQLMQKTESRPFGEKLNAVQFCEALIEQRAEQLKQFEEMSKMVLDSEPIAAVGNHAIALEQMTKEVEEAVRIWKECSDELDDFRADLTALMTVLRSNVSDLERSVAAKEKAAAGK